MNIKESISDTRKGFEESFATGDFYNKQTQDSRTTGTDPMVKQEDCNECRIESCKS